MFETMIVESVNSPDIRPRVSQQTKGSKSCRNSSNIVGFFVVMVCSVCSGFSPTRISHVRQPPLYSAPPTTNYESMTVKELKQLLQDTQGTEPGILTKLKRKQDIIDYLRENLPASAEPIATIIEIMDESFDEMKDIDESDEEDDESPAEQMEHDSSQTPLSALSQEMNSFPIPLKENLTRRGITSLLPIQSASYQHILEGNDAVVHAPTGSGKTLAFVLPLAARMMTSKRMTPFAKGKHSTERYAAISPRIITLVPSRELAKQVGKEWAKYSNAPVATVFGGVPIERHTSLIRKGGGAHVIVSTPGRLRELVREGYVDYKHIHVLVLDEADAMLDEADSPDVRSIMNDITNAVGDRETYEEMEYQLVLVSATVNDFVRKFAMDVMEISLKSSSFISVEGHNSRIASSDPSSIQPLKASTPTVQHWYTSAKSSVRQSIAADLISTLAPRLTIIFVNTKLETETVGSYLANKLSTSAIEVRILHGDMAQAQRSRTLSLLREGSNDDIGGRQVLVATDVASRGLDLRNVDLVIQFGIPRTAGKEGTYNVELYTHRTGRAGRAGRNTKLGAANAILLYDPAEGEGKLILDLIQDVHKALGAQIQPKPAPSSSDIVQAGYSRVTSTLFECVGDQANTALVSYFGSRLASDSRIDTSDPKQLLQHLATVMATLSNLDPSISPQNHRSSLMSGDTRDRTLRVYRKDGIAVSPPEVTKFCKLFGSGKLGRVTISADGSAIFDLATARADTLVQTIGSRSDETHGWCVEMPSSLPTV